MARESISDAEILAQIPAARARDARDRKQGRRAASARYDRRAERVVLELTNGFLFAFPVRAIPELRAATPTQRAAVEVNRGGSALRWAALDVDLSVAGLLLSAVGADERRRDVARMLGQATSPTKAATSRANGAMGGRPRKSAPATLSTSTTSVRTSTKQVAAGVRRTRSGD
jgi:hypothetical protein